MTERKPTTVSKVETALAKAGFTSDSALTLDAYAPIPGRGWYPEFATVAIGRTNVDFYERYTEDRVELATSVTPDQLCEVAKVIADTHKSARHRVRVKAIVSVRTAVAVCDAIRRTSE